MYPIHVHQAAAHYVRSIRNEVKQAYATAYVAYRLRFGHPPALPLALSSLGAQAVRHALRAILERHGFNSD